MKTILVDAVFTYILENTTIDQDMHNLLESYPNKKIVLTSANDEQQKHFKFENIKYPVFTLKHNPEKTDSEYYKRMLVEFELKPEEVIYFEHDPKAVESATSIGIQTHYFDQDKRDLEALKVFLDDNL